MAEVGKALKLAVEIANVLQDVLVHQRSRWGALLGHKHQFEGWWKAEFGLALESWALSSRRRLPSRTYGVTEEAKPKWIHASDGIQADLLVAPWSDERGWLDVEKPPRTWIEIKERSDLWPPTKALEGGLWKDLRKWNGVFTQAHEQTDVVLACHVLSYRTGWEQLPEPWENALQSVVNEGFVRPVDPRVVGYELPLSQLAPEESKPQYLWARIDIFQVFPR